MDIETAKLLFQILQFLLTGGVGIYVYLTAKNRVTNERITTLQEDIDVKLDDHGERIAALETRAETAPTHDDLSRLHEKINDVGRGVSNLTGEVGGVKNLLNTIHEYLLRGVK